MSDDTPRDKRDRRPPPNLGLGLKDKPEVKALLGELSRDLKPGEDPLFYEMPDSPDDASACAPDAARVYVGPTAPPMAHHKTMEMDRVKVAPAVDPRRAVTQRVAIRRPGASPMGPDVGREDAQGDAPPMSGPASAGPKSTAGRKRTAVVGVIAVGAVAAAIVAATWGPQTTEKGAAGTVQSTTAAVPSVRAVPSAGAAASPYIGGSAAAPVVGSATAVTPSVPPPPPVKAPVGTLKGPLDDPYDGAVAPSPAVTAEPSATPSAAPTLTPTAQPAVVPKAPATATSARPTPLLPSGPILGEKE